MRISYAPLATLLVAMALLILAPDLVRAEPGGSDFDPVLGDLSEAEEMPEGSEDDEPLFVNPAWFDEDSEDSSNGVSDSTGGGYEPGGSMADRSIEPSDLPADLVEAAWLLIDRNEDGRATDREVYNAIRDARRLANSREEEHAQLSAAAKSLFDSDADGLLDRLEAIELLSMVRGVRCPTAARAKRYWESLDSNADKTVDASEVVAKLEPLGTVGAAMSGPLSDVLEKVDLNRNDQIDLAEAYYSANSLLRVQLATEGGGIASRAPGDWMRSVGIVSALDVDADNYVSAAEAAAAGMQAGMFVQIDTSGDQRLTPSEMCDMQERIDAQLRAALAAATARSSGGMCGG